MSPLVAALVSGAAAGAGIGILTRVVETSRIAFGPYALYGNGALAVPQVLAPVALFFGWAWLESRGGSLPAPGTASPIPGALFGLALVLGSGIAYGIVALSVGAIAGGVLGYGLLLIAPVAVIGALTLGVIRASRIKYNTAVLWILFFVAAVLASLPPLSFIGGFGMMGVTVGAGLVLRIAAGGDRTAVVGALVTLLAVLQAFALPVFLFMQRGGIR